MSDYSEASAVLQLKTKNMLDHIRRGHRLEALREWNRLEEAMLIIRGHVKNMPDRMSTEEALEAMKEKINPVEIPETNLDD